MLVRLACKVRQRRYLCQRTAHFIPEGLERQRRKPIALSNTLGKWPEQMADAVRVIADEHAITRQHRIAVTNSYEYPSHAEHAPRTIENFFDASLAVNHPRIELAQYVAHLGHALD